MRWFARRLVFYAFALWVAMTLNFLLPRLMPGDPLAGLLQRISARRSSPRTRGSSRPTRRCSGGGTTRSGRTTSRTCGRIVALQLRHLDVELPDARLRGHRPHAAVLDLPRRRRLHARVRPRHGHRDDRRVAPRRRRRQRLRRRRSWPLGAFPAFFTALLAALLPRAEGGLVPDPARVRHSDSTPGLQLAVPLAARSATRSCRSLVIVAAFAGGWVLNMRTVMINTIDEDYVDDGARQGPAATAA